MSILGKKGYPVSFECSDLIYELKQDIIECGKDKMLIVWLRNYKEHGIEIAVNYDFYVEEMPITKEEVNDDERIVIMSAESLLDRLSKQNDITNVYVLD